MEELETELIRYPELEKKPPRFSVYRVCPTCKKDFDILLFGGGVSVIYNGRFRRIYVCSHCLKKKNIKERIIKELTALENQSQLPLPK